jgi:hypothetical protein
VPVRAPGCSVARRPSMWEKNRPMVYAATVEWLREGKVNGMSSGTVRLGY